MGGLPVDNMDRSVHNCAMARPVEFDTGRARDRALLLFWRKGYQATSLPDLLSAMGIGRSSFYAAFGDKRALFVDCLDLFAERTRQVLRKAREHRPPLDALQFFFERHLEGPGRGRASLGCMLVNTVLEMAGVDDDLSDRASRHLSDIERLFDATLRDAGCAPAQSRELAQMLMLLNEGVRVASRRRLSTRAQLDPIAATFRLLRQQLATPPGLSPAPA
jgi:TetR/AcrR family transcriptional repressor of nem operon